MISGIDDATAAVTEPVPSQATVRAVGAAQSTARKDLSNTIVETLRRELIRVTREYLATLRPVFAAMPKGRWALASVRNAELLPAVSAATDAYGVAVRRVIHDALVLGQRAAFVHGVQAGRVGLAHIGVEPAAASVIAAQSFEESFRRSGRQRQRINGHLIEVFRDAEVLREPLVDHEVGAVRARAVIAESGNRVWIVDGMLPGGHVERGESCAAAAVRETLEETGLLIEVTGWVCDVRTEGGTVRYYAARRIGGKLTGLDHDGHDAVRVHLVNADRVPGLMDRCAIAELRASMAGELEEKGDGDEERWVTMSGRPVLIGGDDPATSGRNPKISMIADRAFTGEPVATKRMLTKQQTGALGEKLAIAYLKEQGFKDARAMNVERNNFPVDLVQDHEVIEVKAGLIGNSRRAQRWRMSIGEPGKAEKALLKKMSPEQKAKWNGRKQEAIRERKNAALAEASRRLNRPVKARTMTMVINPDTQRADLYQFDGWHDRIGWNSSQAKRGYIGSIAYK